MTSAHVAPAPTRQRGTPGPGDSSSARRLATASVMPLSQEEYQKIERFGSQLKVPLKTLEEMRRTTVELREQIAALSYEEPKGLFARCAAWVSTKFGAKDALAPTREQLEQQLSENLRQIRRFTEKVIQPKVNAIRSKYEGKTFERTKDTPRPLVLASVPTEKVGKIPTHEALFAAIERFAQSKEQPAFKIVARDGDNSITISRLNKDNMEETIRLSYRRPGKVDAEIVGPYDVQSGPFWNDDALKLVRAFTAGHNLSVKPAKFKSYTIA